MPRPKSFQIERAFNAAYKSVKANREALNALDGVNGNHGDNAASNFKIISQAVKGAKGQPPSAQLAHAAEQLASKGQGGTAQHYVNGLREASRKFEGRERLGQNDMPALLQSLMGNVPAQGHQPAAAPRPQASSSSPQNNIGDLLGALSGQGNVQPSGPAAHSGGAPAAAGGGSGASVLSALLGMATGGGAATQAAPAAGDPLSALLGAAGGQSSSAAQDPFSALLGGAAGGGQSSSAAQDPFSALLGGAAGGQSGAAQDPFSALLGSAVGGGQAASAQPQDPLGGLLSSLIPDKPGLDLADVIQAGAAYMGAQSHGAGTADAALQAVMAAMRGVNPMASGSARTASGGLLAQSILDDAFGKKK